MRIKRNFYHYWNVVVTKFFALFMKKAKQTFYSGDTEGTKKTFIYSMFLHIV